MSTDFEPEEEDRKPEPFQDGKLKVMAKRCEECLYTKNRIVADASAATILKKLAVEESYFICHKFSIAGESGVCRGFYGSAHSCQLVQVAQRLGAVVFINPDDYKQK